MSRLCILLLAAGLFVPASISHATTILDGAVIETTYLFPNESTVIAGPVEQSVGSGIELLGFAGLADIDFSDTNILITTVRDGPSNDVAFDGFRFFDVNGTIPAFTFVALNQATTFPGLNASHVTFDANTIFVNLAKIGPSNAGSIISLDLAPQALPVPEPGTLTLVGLGSLVAACARGRCRRRG